MKIPAYIISIFENEIGSVGYGQVSLTVYLRGSKLRYEIGKKISLLDEPTEEGKQEEIPDEEH